MKTNYEFSFNPNLQQLENQEEINILTFLKEIFPYLSIRSATFCMFMIQLLWFALSINSLTLIPSQKEGSKQKNIIVELMSNLIYIVLVGRLGSQYEAKLGNKYYISIIIIIQFSRFLLAFFLRFYQNNLIIVNNSSLLSLYILSLINLQKWKENEILQFQTEQKTVQNYDLLDLNDTVIKLKPSESSFMYESYTNKQFYFHNLNTKEEKIQKNTTKHGKKYKKSNKFIEQTNSEEESYQLRYFKLILFHFIAYSTYPFKEFIIFSITELIIYFLFVSKLLKRMAFF